MKAADWINAFEKFFNDILGTLIPGALLLILLSYAGLTEFIDLTSVTLIQQNFLFLISAYLLGHILDQLSQTFPFANVIKFFDKDPSPSRGNNIPIFKALVGSSTEQLSDEALDALDERNLRSMAMSMSDEGKFLSRKFRFLQLLCTSSSVAIIIAVIVDLVNIRNEQSLGMKVVFVTIGAICAFLLIRRGNEFNRRSQYVCFDCVVAENALAGLQVDKEEEEKKK